MAGLNLLFAVFIAGMPVGSIRLASAQIEAPVVPGDIQLSGYNVTSPNAGVVTIGDILNCTANCNPSPFRYEWTFLNTGAVTNESTVQVTSLGVLRYRCKVFNNVSGVQHNANKSVEIGSFPVQLTTTTTLFPPVTVSTARPTVCYSRSTDISTVHGLFGTPKEHSPPLKFYFGYVQGSHDAAAILQCERVCQLEPRCLSYTYISKAYPTDPNLLPWRGQCMGTNDVNKIRASYPGAYSGIWIGCSGTTTEPTTKGLAAVLTALITVIVVELK